MTPHARITHTERGRSGNAGFTRDLGEAGSVPEAKTEAQIWAGSHGVSWEWMWWQEYSPTTWGLMEGDHDTGITVSWVEDTAPGGGSPEDES